MPANVSLTCFFLLLALTSIFYAVNDYVACRLPASRQHPTPRVAYLVILKEAMVLTEPSSSGGGMAVARSIAPLHLVESAIDRQDGRVVSS